MKGHPHFQPEEVIIKLKKLIKTIERISSDMDSGGITRSQVRVIFPIIKDDKGYTIQELADIGGVTKGLVSRTIADLEAKGFVQRDKEKETQDRNIKIILTAKGSEFVAEKKAKMHQVSNKWGGKITFDEMNTFWKVLVVLTE